MDKVKLNRILRYGITIVFFGAAVILFVLGILGMYDMIAIEGLWSNMILIYLSIAMMTFIPIIKNMLFNDDILLSYDEKEISTTKFSEENKAKLIKYNLMMEGTLKFWKRQVRIYRSIHYYCVIWTTLLAVLMPILIQALPQEGKMILTIISAHSAIMIAFHKGLKIEGNYKSYRLCESDFYDEYRKIVYNGTDEKKIEEQNQIVNNYIEKINSIRKIGRSIEIDNMPSIQEQSYEKEVQNE